MFKKIYYNPMNNRIHLWETIEKGKTRRLTVQPDIEYYIPDKTETSDKKDIWGNPVKLQTSTSRKNMKEFVQYSNIPTCETSLPEDVKFLQKRYGGQTLIYDIDNFQIATIDIEIEADNNFPDPDKAKKPINLISVHYSKTNEIFTFGNREYTGNDKSVKNYHYCNDEETLIRRFIKHFRKKKVDIITGWNVKFFDIPYIINRCAKLDIEIDMSPLNISYPKKFRDDFGNTIEGYGIAGISILDGLELYKKFTYKKQVSYSLNYIGIEEVKEGKLDLDGQVNHMYKTDWNKFVEYNIQDVLLTKKINDNKKFIELTISLCYQALIPFENVFSSISLITGYIVNYLHKQNIVFPDPPQDKIKEEYPGAHVMAKQGMYEYVISFDVESMYPHMIMMYNISPETLVLNPTNTEGLIKTPASKEYSCNTPSGKFSVKGIYYTKEKQGVLSKIVETIFNNRKQFRKKMQIAEGIEEGLSKEKIIENLDISSSVINELYDEIIDEGFDSKYYDSQQQIRKILINSIYGVLGNKYFSFYNIKNAMAITIGGRHLIEFLSNNLNNYIKKYWHKIAKNYFPEVKNKEISEIKNDVVVLIDTDSNYICLDEIIKSLDIKFKSDDDFRLWANNFDKKFFTPFFNKLLEKYAANFEVNQIINFKREKIISKKIILAKKKYADLTIDKEGKIYNPPKLDVTGIEIVRTSTPKFCREKLKDTLRFILENKERGKTINKIREIYNAFLKCKIEDISYPRSVNNYTKYARPVQEYINFGGVVYPKSCPQHVKASINYNFLITKYNLNLEPIGNGSKVKYIKVNPKNELQTNVVAYLGKYPDKFKEIFKIDYEEQWVKSFQEVIQRFFDVIDWGDVALDSNCIEEFITF